MGFQILKIPTPAEKQTIIFDLHGQKTMKIIRHIEIICKTKIILKTLEMSF